MSSGYGALEALLTPDESTSIGAPAASEKAVTTLLNPNPTVWISFTGGSNQSVATFIQSVQRVAFMQNRIEDDKWMAQYASTCFTDSALMWYLSLEEKTQTTWKKLRLALVQRYPVVQSPRPAPIAVPAKPEVPSPEITKIGQIEVIRAEFGDVFGYLSQDSTGKFVVDPSQEKALKLAAVLHTNAKNQHENIYSLKLLDVRA
ncbi:hypothetical protein FS837_012915 [Tulasnella sp. UAMH 9824]|nr:hypothetical protein FS837_012915 [Tulasnella sp. UAMH 9824]